MTKPTTIAKAVVRKRLAIAAKQTKLNEQLAQLQTDCPHISLRYKNEGSTGNWDRDDSYWRCWYCPDCNRRWTTDQSNEQLNQYPHAQEISRWRRDEDLYNNFYKPNC